MPANRRSGATAATLATLSVLVVGPALAQTAPAPLAIERDPPIATRPVFTPPVVVPPAMPGAPAGVTGTPVPPQPIPVPAGPGPVAVPPAPAPTPIAPPIVPPPQASSHPAAAPVPVAAPPSEAPAVVPAPAAPAPVPVPTAPTTELAPAPAPTVPPVAEPSVPQTIAPTPAPAPVAPPAAPAPKPPAVVEDVLVPERPVIFVTGTTTWEASEQKLDKVFVSLGEAVKKLGATPVGGPLVEYIETDSDDVGFRAMVPLAAEPKGKLPKGVKVGRSPGGKALKFRHSGPIDDLEEVYARIDDELLARNVDGKIILEEYDADALASPEDRSVLDIYVFTR